MRPTTGMPSFSRMKNSRFTWARRTIWPRFTRALVRGRRFTIVFIGLINVNQYYSIWQDDRIPLKFAGGESCLSQQAEHSLGWTAEGGRPYAVRGDAGVRTATSPVATPDTLRSSQCRAPWLLSSARTFRPPFL